MKLSDLYRRLPHFKGKYQLGRWIFKNSISQKLTEPIKGKRGIVYNVMNTHDSVGRDIFFDGIYEPETVSLIEKLLQPNDVLVDAGANVGAVCLPIAARNGVQVYAFEPGPNIFDALKQNVRLNGLRNISIFRKALSDKSGQAGFYESDRVHGWSGLVKIDSFEKYEVEATTLDEFCREQLIDKIKVLKIDVQGWEYFVLMGADGLLNDNKIDHIILEFEWWAEKNAGLPVGKAQEYLLERGFELRYLNGERLAEPLRTGTVMLWASRD